MTYISDLHIYVYQDFDPGHPRWFWADSWKRLPQLASGINIPLSNKSDVNHRQNFSLCLLSLLVEGITKALTSVGSSKLWRPADGSLLCRSSDTVGYPSNSHT